MDEKFTNYLINRGRSQRTISNYGEAMADFAQWFEKANGRPLAPCDLTPTDARQYRASMIERGLAPATVNLRLSALRAYANCYKLELGQVRGLAEQELAPRWLDKSAQAKLIREIERDINLARTQAAIRQAARNKAIIMLLIGAGLRIGELIALEVGDLEIGERGGHVVVRQGKGDKRRIVPLNADVRQALRAWLAVRPEGRKVFINQRRNALCENGVRNLLGDYARRAGVKVTPHQLRHSFAKNLINANVSIDHVRLLMGHTDMRSTLRYVIPDEHDLARDVARLEA